MYEEDEWDCSAHVRTRYSSITVVSLTHSLTRYSSITVVSLLMASSLITCGGGGSEGWDGWDGWDARERGEAWGWGRGRECELIGACVGWV